MDKRFFRIFLFSFLALTFLYVGIIEFFNPHLTGIFNYREFEKWTTNIEYVKYRSMEKVEGVETLIVGSSTSEAYHPSDVDKLYSTRSYVTSLGGADTPSRTVFIKKAIKEFKNLKRIIYIADFFEFNKYVAKPQVAFNLEMGQELPSYAKPSLLKFIRYYLNHQLLEDSFNIVKRKKKNKQIEVGSNGATSRSMVLSSVQVEKGINNQLDDKKMGQLMEYIIENSITYKTSVLNNFEQLNPTVVKLYEEILDMAKNKEIEIIFILSPYHYEFKKRLKEIPSFNETYAKWTSLLEGYDKMGHVKVISGVNEIFSTSERSGAWRDGIHYSREAAFHLLKQGLD